MKVVILVTGSISAYKAASVVSALVGMNHEVKVAMTENAKKFVMPLTYSALSKNEVYDDACAFRSDGHIYHIELAEWADVVCVVPATYNTMMKIVNGICDNLATDIIVPYLGMNKRLIVVPAMNVNMWNRFLEGSGFYLINSPIIRFVGPIEGRQACGAVGMGKIAKTIDIVDAILKDIVPFGDKLCQ